MRHAKTNPVVVDATGASIIEALQKDGRRSYSSLGKELGLSEAAVRQRVQRLMDAGMMQIVAVTDPVQVGFARQAMVGVRITGKMQPVSSVLSEMTEIVYLVLVSGAYDLLAEVVTESDERLLEIIERIRSIEGVLVTDTLVYLQIRKQTYDEGVRLP